MPLPNDDLGRPPFRPEQPDTGPGDSVPPPAPPAMRSPYRPDEQAAADAPHKRVLRFPALHHDHDHAAGNEQGTGHGQGSGSAADHGALGDQGAARGPYAPYGQPPAPRFAPPGSPSRPTPPAPPASGQAASGRGRLAIGLWAGAAVVAVAVAASVIFLGGKGTHGTIAASTKSTTAPKTVTTSTPKPEIKPAWTAPAVDGDSMTVIGSWLLNNKTIVRGDGKALKAYDTETGNALWTFQPPQGTTICTMSQTAQKIGVVQIGSNGKCDAISGIDTSTGKAVWNAAVAAAPDAGAGTVPLVSFDGDITTGQAGTSLTTWGADGKQLWTVDMAKEKPSCRLGKLTVQGTDVTIIQYCGKGPVVTLKDGHTGRDWWTTPIPPDGLQNARVSIVRGALPTMVRVTALGAQPFERYYVFSSKDGKLQPTVNGEGDFGKLDLNTGAEKHPRAVAYLQDNTFIAPTADKDTDAALVAFDLTSGKKLWQAPATAEGPVTIAALDQNKVTVFEGGTASKPARLLAFAMNGGAPVASGLSEALGSKWSGAAAAAYIAGDRLIVVPAASENNSDVMAFALN